jgi:hypothetical protein
MLSLSTLTAECMAPLYSSHLPHYQKNAEYFINSTNTGPALPDPWKLNPQVVPQRRYGITTLCCLIPKRVQITSISQRSLKSPIIVFGDMSLRFVWLFLSPKIRLLHSKYFRKITWKNGYKLHRLLATNEELYMVILVKGAKLFVKYW